jgi:hypothetical protein
VRNWRVRSLFVREETTEVQEEGLELRSLISRVLTVSTRSELKAIKMHGSFWNDRHVNGEPMVSTTLSGYFPFSLKTVHFDS